MQICLLAYALHAKIEQMDLWASKLLLKNPNHWLSVFKERDGLSEGSRADERSAMFVSFPIMSHCGHEPPTSQTGNPPTHTVYSHMCTSPQVVKIEWITIYGKWCCDCISFLPFLNSHHSLCHRHHFVQSDKKNSMRLKVYSWPWKLNSNKFCSVAVWWASGHVSHLSSDDLCRSVVLEMWIKQLQNSC